MIIQGRFEYEILLALRRTHFYFLQMDVATRDWLLAYHKETYERQIEVTDKIRDRISFLAGLLTPLGGGILYTLLNCPYAASSAAWCYIPAGLAFLTLLGAIALILYALGSGFIYAKTPTPMQLQEYAVELTSFAATHEGTDVLNDLKMNMIDIYSKCATHDQSVNEYRTNCLLRATKIATFSFIVWLFAMPGFFIGKSGQDTEPFKVIITGPIHIKP